ncbi:hypothetical protein BH10BDE1_BH10BDE1_02190 [soil metagenome]
MGQRPRLRSLLLATLVFGFGIVLSGCDDPFTPRSDLASVCAQHANSTLWSDIGTGSLSEPYLICNSAQFASIGKNPSGWSFNYALAGDLDFQAYDRSTSELSISPIGVYDYVSSSNSAAFTGTFDGKGFALKNLKLVAANNQGVGPFGYTMNAVIHDLRITGLDATGASYIGGLVAANKSSVLRDLYVEGRITGTADRLAGLVANNDGSGVGSDASITRAVTNVAITGNVASGGLAGIATFNSGQLGGRADITDSQALGSINMTVAGNTIGGFVAYNIASGGGSAKFTGCSSKGNVVLADQGSFSGTFIGTNTGDGAGTDVSVTRSFTTGSLTTPASFGGGLVGGLIGVNNCTNSANCSITRSYVRGDVTIPVGANNRSGVGLLIGANSGASASNVSIVDSFAIGSINILSSGADQVGGLVGSFGNGAAMPITVERSYSAVSITAVTPGANVGSVFGSISNTGPGTLTVTDTYWDGDLFATGSGVAVTGITTKTSAQLKAAASFPAWDFVSVWKIEEGISSPTL